MLEAVINAAEEARRDEILNLLKILELVVQNGVARAFKR